MYFGKHKGPVFEADQIQSPRFNFSILKQSDLSFNQIIDAFPAATDVKNDQIKKH